MWQIAVGFLLKEAIDTFRDKADDDEKKKNVSPADALPVEANMHPETRKGLLMLLERGSPEDLEQGAISLIGSGYPVAAALCVHQAKEKRAAQHRQVNEQARVRIEQERIEREAKRRADEQVRMERDARAAAETSTLEREKKRALEAIEKKERANGAAPVEGVAAGPVIVGDEVHT